MLVETSKVIKMGNMEYEMQKFRSRCREKEIDAEAKAEKFWRKEFARVKLIKENDWWDICCVNDCQILCKKHEAEGKCICEQEALK